MENVRGFHPGFAERRVRVDGCGISARTGADDYEVKDLHSAMALDVCGSTRLEPCLQGQRGLGKGFAGLRQDILHKNEIMDHAGIVRDGN